MNTKEGGCFSLTHERRGCFTINQAVATKSTREEGVLHDKRGVGGYTINTREGGCFTLTHGRRGCFTMNAEEDVTQKKYWGRCALQSTRGGGGVLCNEHAGGEGGASQSILCDLGASQ